MEELEQRYYHIRRSAIFGKGGGEESSLSFFPLVSNKSPDTNNERSWERERQRKVEKDRENEREREVERMYAGSRVYTRITQTVVGELTYCNYRGNYCRHISRIRSVASLCCSVARLEFSCPSTRQLAG